MEHLGVVRHVESHFGPFADSVILMQNRCTVSPNVPLARKSFRTQTMELRDDGVMWNLVSVHLEIVLVSVQDRCTVCAKRTIGSEIILDAPNGIPR